MVQFRQKYYTQWDETDQLKRMKDSDILAQQKRKANMASDAADTFKSTISGALPGAAIGAATGLAAGATTIGKGHIFQGLAKAGKTAKNLGLVGAGIGAGVGLLKSLKNQAQQKKEREFYNDRLDYAQRHALRREKNDWRDNNLNREGYTY